MSVVPVHNPRLNVRCFRLEFCALPRHEIGKVALSIDHRVTVMVRQAIKYCPFCGANLAKFYRKTFLQLPHVTEEEWS